MPTVKNQGFASVYLIITDIGTVKGGYLGRLGVNFALISSYIVKNPQNREKFGEIRDLNERISQATHESSL